MWKDQFIEHGSLRWCLRRKVLWVSHLGLFHSLQQTMIWKKKEGGNKELLGRRKNVGINGRENLLLRLKRGGLAMGNKRYNLSLLSTFLDSFHSRGGACRRVMIGFHSLEFSRGWLWRGVSPWRPKPSSSLRGCAIGFVVYCLCFSNGEGGVAVLGGRGFCQILSGKKNSLYF
jgi:hypothetical protein